MSGPAAYDRPGYSFTLFCFFCRRIVRHAQSWLQVPHTRMDAVGSQTTCINAHRNTGNNKFLSSHVWAMGGWRGGGWSGGVQAPVAADREREREQTRRN